MEVETLVAPATPVVESVPATPDSQVSEPAAQAVEPKQETTQLEVDKLEQPTSSPVAERAKPSDFYYVREKQKKLDAQLREANQILAQLKKASQSSQQTSSAPTAPPSKDEMLKEFLSDPIGYQEKLLAKARQEILERELPQILQRTESKRSYERNKQEGLELLFPKESPDSKASLEERVNSNPERTKRIMEIYEEYNLALLDNPKKEAAVALQLLNAEKAATPAQPKPAIPKKGQLASTATGNISSGGKKTMTMQEITASYARLKQELSDNPGLRNDPQYQQRRAALDKEFSQTIGKGQQ
jgi:hypothetical protein